jgi:hypothetical protein
MHNAHYPDRVWNPVTNSQKYWKVAMPQASQELRDMFEDDGAAWKELGANFCDDKGIIRRRDKTVEPTPKQFFAIDYLCDEWDYEWEGLRREERL